MSETNENVCFWIHVQPKYPNPEALHLLKCEGKFDFSLPVLPGQGAVLWDGWRPRAGPVRGAPERSFQQLWRQRLRLAVPGGAVWPLPVSAPGWCHAGSAPNAAAEAGPPHCQGTFIPTLTMRMCVVAFWLFLRGGSFEFGPAPVSSHSSSQVFVSPGSLVLC